MKRLNFAENLIPLILSGEKSSTWRLFDDKNLSVGDEIELHEFGTAVPFGRAKIVRVIQKQFKDLTDEDKTGHEKYHTDEEMYKTYTAYYKTKVGPETKLKIIWFTIEK